jgi:hypothetical protein
MPQGMDPKGLDVREACDSTDHPCSVPVIINLDVTGSMGTIPHTLIKTGLPTLVQSIIDAGIPDPAILFTGIGDHISDRCPLQVGQFESSDELLDHWLTTVYLEGGGGATGCESYILAWYLAAQHTKTDHWDKRQKKGHLFTIGDEMTHPDVGAGTIAKIFGSGQGGCGMEILETARERWHVKHINVLTSTGRRPEMGEFWEQLMGDDLLIAQNSLDIPQLIADEVCKVEGTCKTEEPNVPQAEGEMPSPTTTPEVPLL